MQNNVLDYLEETVRRLPDKAAFVNDKENITFLELYQGIHAIGSALARRHIYREAVLIFMEKSPSTIEAFLGVISGGCYYVPLDAEMPQKRIELIIESTQARLMICDENSLGKARGLNFPGRLFYRRSFLRRK